MFYKLNSLVNPGSSKRFSHTGFCQPFSLLEVMRRFPPTNDRAKSFKPKLLSVFNFPYPIPQAGCMLDNKRGAVGGQNIVLQAVEKNGFLDSCGNFFCIPCSGVDQPMVAPLLA